MKRIKFWLLFAFMATTIWAQEAVVFVVKKRDIKLKMVPYSWGNELLLTIKGKGNPALKGSYLTITIFYQEYRAAWFQIPLKKEFSKQWQPINKATSEILPGDYTVIVDFDLSTQNQKIQDIWKKDKRFSGKKPNKIVRLFKIGSDKDFAEYSSTFRKFYLQRIRNLNNVFLDLQNQTKKALRIQMDIVQSKPNPFVAKRQFSAEKWREWLYNSYHKKVAEEKSILVKHRKQVFFPRFYIANKNMVSYCDLLSKVGKITTGNIYKALGYNRNIPINRSGLNNISYLMLEARRLNTQSQDELGVDLQKELGYLPPPGLK